MPADHRQFGLIGYPLGHSYSKRHFSEKFEREGLTDCSYENFAIATAAELTGIIRQNPALLGLNVTIPHKQNIIPYLDELDEIAAQIGAVNTLRIRRKDGKVTLKGYNTDVTGFTVCLKKWLPGGDYRALVFGTGGSSLAIRYSLISMGIPFVSVSRQPSGDNIIYQDIDKKMASTCKLWINCTPVGMHPATEGILPLPYEVLTREHYLFDLIYNPALTRFLDAGKRAGAQVMNGSAMLYEQAEASWKIWNDLTY